ncbi:MAG: high-potential iron-sulfur protein [Persicimonas sp.]
MSQDELNRRDFFKRAALLGAAAAGAGSLLAACERPSDNGGDEGAKAEKESEVPDDLECDDVSDLEESEIKTRESLEYTDESPEEDEFCDNCNLYTEPEEPGECGGCTTVPGPIHPKGWCTAWVEAA